MKTWVKWGRAAIGMGLIWALGGLLLGGLVELADNVVPGGLPATHVVDMWPQTLAILAFPRGVLFALVLAVIGRRRRFEDFSLGEFAGWGGVVGVVLAAIAMLTGADLGFALITTGLSAIAGVSSLALARKAERWGLLAGEARERPLNEGKARELLR